VPRSRRVWNWGSSRRPPSSTPMKRSGGRRWRGTSSIWPNPFKTD